MIHLISSEWPWGGWPASSCDSQTLQYAEPDRINNVVRPAVASVVNAIHGKAPTAKILLMGYPRLFESDCFPGIDWGDVTWMSRMADTLNAALGNAAADARAQSAAPVTFADPTAAFTGKAICGSPESIRELDLLVTRGDHMLVWGQQTVS